MAAWSRKTKLFKVFNSRFLGNMTPYEKFSKFCSESIRRLTDRRVVQISWNLADGKSVKYALLT